MNIARTDPRFADPASIVIDGITLLDELVDDLDQLAKAGDFSQHLPLDPHRVEAYRVLKRLRSAAELSDVQGRA